MKTDDIILLGLKNSVTAISRSTGERIWCTSLKGPSLGVNGHEYVSLATDQTRVFAHSAGYLHCLDLKTGQLLWTNELKGYGFGLANLCLPGNGNGNATGAGIFQQQMTANDAAMTAIIATTAATNH